MNFLPTSLGGDENGHIPTPEITPNDVLCGRGGDINGHVGNEKFRKIVEGKRLLYLTARYKREKRIIAASVVEEIRSLRPPGRFLCKVQLEGHRRGRRKAPDLGWQEVGDGKAIEKASQALRENAPMIRKEMKECLPPTSTDCKEQNRSSKRSKGEDWADEFDDSLFFDDDAEHSQGNGEAPHQGLSHASNGPCAEPQDPASRFTELMFLRDFPSVHQGSTGLRGSSKGSTSADSMGNTACSLYSESALQVTDDEIPATLVTPPQEYQSGPVFLPAHPFAGFEAGTSVFRAAGSTQLQYMGVDTNALPNRTDNFFQYFNQHKLLAFNGVSRAQVSAEDVALLAESQVRCYRSQSTGFDGRVAPFQDFSDERRYRDCS